MKSTTTKDCFQATEDKKSHSARSGKYGGCGKLSPVSLQVPLGQSDVHERCRAATVNTLYAKVQFAYGELNHVTSEG